METPNLPETPPDVSPLAIPMVAMGEDPHWEYRRILRNLATEEPPTEEELNELGADGWELTGVFSDSRALYFYFKRPA